MNYVKVWAHGFAQQEGRTKGREYLVSWWCSSPEWRSRTAATVAGAPGLQRVDAVPEMVARTLGPKWCVLDRAQSPLRVAARRAEADGGDRPRARRVQAAGQGSSKVSVRVRAV
jgi:hypothetical protein